MNQEILHFIFKLFTFIITLYFICDFVQKTDSIDTHISIGIIIVITIIVCIIFVLIRCKKQPVEKTLLLV